MTMKYDDAVIALYQAPLDKFVGERKRLSSELKAAGDKTGAARLAGLGRPPISAWTVNQLFWQDRAAFDELFAAGERLRAGDLAATSAHREAMVKLRARAETLLGAAGHATTEATLRRIMTDLSALAAAGSFDPDPPGALSGDREPPGFDLVGLAAVEAAPAPDSHKRVNRDGKEHEGGKRTKDADARRERQEREQLERDRRKAEAERAKKRAERERLEKSLRSAKAELQAHTHQVDRLQSELAKAEKAVAQTQAAIAELASRLAGLDLP
jgi:valyl-tRNA synthetase